MNLWNRDTKRITAVIGIAIVAWNAVSGIIPFPDFMVKAFLGPVSLLTIAAGFACYGLYQLATY